MKRSIDDHHRRRMGDRRTQALGLVLPLAGLALLMPPFVMVFAAPVTILGAPLIAVYVFTVWAGLIVAAFRLSRRLSRAPAPTGAEDDGIGP